MALNTFVHKFVLIQCNTLHSEVITPHVISRGTKEQYSVYKLKALKLIQSGSYKPVYKCIKYKMKCTIRKIWSIRTK